MMTRASVFTPVFSSFLAPVFARYVDLKRALGRCFDLPARTLPSLDQFLCHQKRKVLGPECCRVSGVVSHPRTRYFGSLAGSHAGGSELLLVSPPDRAAVLRSGPQLLSALPSTAAEYALEIRDQNGLGEPRRIILGHPPAFPYAPRNCNLHADSGYFAAIFSDSFSIW